MIYKFFAIVLLLSSSVYAQPQRPERNIARTKATLAQALSESSWKDGETIRLQGRNSANDGGGGEFQYDADATNSVDGVFVLPGKGGTMSYNSSGAFNGTAGTGRLIALDKTEVNVKKAGAVADWNGVVGLGADGTDDSAAFIAARAAAVANNIPLYIPSGDYYLESNFAASGLQSIYGDGFSTRIYNDTTNVIDFGILEVDASVANLCLILGDTDNGAGIATSSGSTANIFVSGVRITNCGDGTLDSGKTPIILRGTGVANVTNCLIEDCIGNTIDAFITVATLEFVISHNTILHDRATDGSFASHGIGTASSSQSCRGVIANNYIRGFKRYGIQSAYDVSSVGGRVTIDGNAIYDCTGPGIILSGNPSGGELNAVISNNNVAYCGGENAGVDGGIFVGAYSSETTLAITGNSVNKSGYNIDNTERSQATGSIRLSNGTGQAVVSGNATKYANNSELFIFNCKDVTVSGNSFTDAKNRLILLQASGAGNKNQGIVIANNTLASVSVDCDGVVQSVINGASLSEHILIEGNFFRNDNMASTQNAIEMGGLPFPGLITNNHFLGWKYGVFNSSNAALTGFEYGSDLVIENNRFEDINDTVFVLGYSLAGFLYGRNSYDNCNAIITSGFERRWLEGEVRGNGQKVAKATDSPNNTVGSWSVGDIVENSAPSIGEPSAWICTISGSPGTWVALYDYPVGFAQISIEDNATATTVASTQSDWSAKSQFVGFGTNFSDSSNATPDHTNDHITLTSAGTWEVSCVVTLSGSVVSDLWELALWKNNGATQVSTKQGVNIRGAGLTYENHVTISGLVDASVNDTIELWVQRTNGTGSITITNAVMTAKKVSD